MKLLKTLQTIELLDQLICNKKTGTPVQLSERLQLSERSIYNILQVMKEMGAPIYYNKMRQSYCYLKEVQFEFGFYNTRSEERRISG